MVFFAKMRNTALMTAMRFRQAIVTALSDEMESDERVILFGEDVAAAESAMAKPAVTAAPAATTGGRAEDILAMIRNRKTQ